uniref:Immunoglobulin V-set domain-containing protein n=1 Tax=Amphiprion percula TaxID=161767 RepID=A0A3P8SBB5_AMPPE
MSAKDKMIFLLILCLTGNHLIIPLEMDLFIFIFCSHNKTDYFQMLWYQRSPGETAMKLIGYLYVSDPTVEEQYKDNFNIIGDLSGSSKKNGSLKIQVVGPEQGAVYYCAASKAQEREKTRWDESKG